MNIKDLIEMYNSGLSYEEIAVKIGMSKKWVINKLRGNVISRPAKRHQKAYEVIKWETKAERDELILALYRSGDGSITISHKLHITKKTALKVLNQHGVIDKSRTSLKLSPSEINRLYSIGLSSSEIASQLGCSNGAVLHHIKNPRKSAEALYKIPKDIQEQILKLYTIDKLSSYQIAEKFGYTYQRVQNFLRRQKVSIGSLTPAWKAAVQRGIKSGGSSLEKAVEQILLKLEIDYQAQYELDEFRYDFGISDGNILIEVQGSYWHNLKARISRDTYKRKLAAKHGKKLLIIWDHELSKPEVIECRILNAIKPVVVDFKQFNIKIAEWPDAKNLLMRFHYQGCGRAGLSIGAYDNDKLTAVATFCRPMRQETATKQNIAYSDILELARLVINPSYQSRNFASWFLSRAVKLLAKNNECKMLIAFADPTFGHVGIIYKSSNWKYDGTTSASYWYYHRRQNTIIHKKTVWNAAKRAGLSEDAYAKTKNYLKVHGQPKMRYILDI